MLDKKNLGLKRYEGSAMLVVVIIMSIILMMSSIIFGYAVRSYRLSGEMDDVIMSRVNVDTALADTLVEILRRVDLEESLTAFTLAKGSIMGDATQSYEVKINPSGTYNPSDFQVTSHKETYILTRNYIEPLVPPEEAIPPEEGTPPEEEALIPPEPEAIMIEPIAVEIKGMHKDYNTIEKVLLVISSDEVTHYQVDVYRCYD